MSNPSRSDSSAGIGNPIVDQVNDSLDTERIHPRSAPSFFHGAAYVDARHSTFTGAGRDNITNFSSASEVKELLSTLKPVDSSGYYVQPCMEGTRENILGEIDEWLEDFRAPNILWITGSPGLLLCFQARRYHVE